MIPLVEFSFDSPENRDGGETTGTINPGVLYETKYFQIGAEAIIPVNNATGHDVGAIIQIANLHRRHLAEMVRPSADRQ